MEGPPPRRVPSMTVSAPRESDRSAGRSIPDTVAQLRATYRGGRTRPVAWRIAQLEAIVRMVAEREKEFAEALGQDLGRGAVEAWLADLAPVTAEAKFALKHVRKWMKPDRV